MCSRILPNFTKYQCNATSSQILGRFFGGYGSYTHGGSEFVDGGIFWRWLGFSTPILLSNHTQLCPFWIRLHIFMISLFFEQIVKHVRILTDFVCHCNWCETWFSNAVWQGKERTLYAVQYTTEAEFIVEEGK